MRPRRPWYRTERKAWYVEIAGRQHLLAAGPKEETRDHAEQRYHELMLEIRDNPPVDGGNPTVASIIEAFLEWASVHLKPRTYSGYRSSLQKFADVHGGRLVRDAKAYHLTKWVDDHREWKTDWTRGREIRSVKRPFSWAVKQGLIPINPYAAVGYRNGDPRRPMADDEFDALLRAADPASGMVEILRFAALTGCRPEDIRLLKWSEVDLATGRIVRTDHKTSTTQRQRGKPKVIYLVPELVEMLRAMMSKNFDSEYVFLHRRGKPWGRCSISQHIGRLRKKIRLPDDVVLYGLRHRLPTTAPTILTSVQQHRWWKIP